MEGWQFLDVVHHYRMEMTDDPAEKQKFNDELVGELVTQSTATLEEETKPTKPKLAPPKWWKGSQNASDANMSAIKLAENARKKRGGRS